MTISQHTLSTLDDDLIRSRGERPERVIARIGDSSRGPTLVCISALHGNEPAGWIGLRRVVDVLESQEVELAGELLALVGNCGALAQEVRWVDLDLNRVWLPERIGALEEGAEVASHEEAEMIELGEELHGAIDRASGETWLLDLHTTSGEGPPFGVLDDTLPNREFAGIFNIPFVVGLEEELDGTVLGYFVSRGVRTFGLECGQHDDPRSADVAEAAIWLALVGTGLAAESVAPDLETCRDTLLEQTRDLPGTVEIRYRHAVSKTDNFRMDPGWSNFQSVGAGARLAIDNAGEVNAPESGLVLMPLYQRQGGDGFFVVHPVRPLWMRLSGLARRLNAERFLHWLPGVRRAGAETDGFIVNRHVARWFALEILHLMGFRRHGSAGHYLVVSRRPNDR